MRSCVASAPLISIAIVFLTGCGGDGTTVVFDGGLPDTVTVTISGMNAPFDIDPDPALVDPGDRLGFVHTTADTLEIDLRVMPPPAISPFADSLLLAVDGGITFTTVSCGAEPDTIKYSVTVTIGGQSSTEDPEIIVRPR